MIAEFSAPLMIIAAGQVMLLICGEIDLAVGRVYALAPAIVYVVSSEEQHGYPIWVGVLAALGCSALVGLTNGVITTVFRVPSFITTLGMLFLLNGITLHLLEGTQVFMPGGEVFRVERCSFQCGSHGPIRKRGRDGNPPRAGHRY